MNDEDDYDAGRIENNARIGVRLKEQMQEAYRHLGRSLAHWSSQKLPQAIFYGILIASVPVVLSILAWPVLLVWFAAPVGRILQFPLGRAFALGLVALLGFVLYFVRENFKRLYGLAEIAIGLASAWAGFPRLAAEPLPGALAVAGGVYIIVFGVGNYVVGRTLPAWVRKPVKETIDEPDKEHDEEA